MTNLLKHGIVSILKTNQTYRLHMKLRYLLLLCFSAVALGAEDTIITESTSTSDVTTTTKLESPPPSAITPTMNISNSDLCTVGVAGAVQTQILGISMGTTVRDMNCEKLKNAKTLYDMGMKVAAVSIMCQDERVFDAMMNAGTPCPYQGLIGDDAKAAWLSNSQDTPEEILIEEEMDEKHKQTLLGVGSIFALLALLLI